MIPGTGCHLSIEQQTIPSYHRPRILVSRGRHRLLQHIQQTLHTSDEAFSLIDWESHFQAIRLLSNNKPHLHSKVSSQMASSRKTSPPVQSLHLLYSMSQLSVSHRIFRTHLSVSSAREWQDKLYRDLQSLLLSIDTNPVLLNLSWTGSTIGFIRAPTYPLLQAHHTMTSYQANPTSAGINSSLADVLSTGQLTSLST
jgi:hypothetical protein